MSWLLLHCCSCWRYNVPPAEISAGWLEDIDPDEEGYNIHSGDTQGDCHIMQHPNPQLETIDVFFIDACYPLVDFRWIIMSEQRQPNNLVPGFKDLLFFDHQWFPIVK